MSEKWWDMSDDELDDLFREASDKAEIPFDSSALDKLRQKIDFKPIPQPEPSQGFKKRWIALASILFFSGVALLYTFSGKKGDSKQNNNSVRISQNTLPSSKLVDEKTSITIDKKANSLESKQANIAHTEVEHEKDLKELGNLPNNNKSEVIVDKNNSLKTNTSKGNSTNAKVLEGKIAFNNISTNAGNFTSKKWYGKTNKKGVKSDYSFNKKTLSQELSNSNQVDDLIKNKALDISNTKTAKEKTSTTINKLNDSNSTVVEQDNNNSGVNYPIISYSSKTNNKQSKFKKLNINSNQIYNRSIYSEINASVIPENKPIEEETIIKANFSNVDFLTNKAIKPLETNVELESPTYVDAPPIVMKQPKFSRFGIRLAIAPEINSIERMETSAVVGSLFGLLLEYRLTKKLTLQTGISYSKKKYTGDFEYYYAWTSASPKPINIDGICSVVDVPINLRLNALQMNRNTFFISGGVSSYIMSDEVYTYNYAWGPPKVRDWTGNSSSFYWSTLNLSAGVERKMNKHFTLQVEPFLKTPLVGVGRGLVNLYSSGLLFSTKYEF